MADHAQLDALDVSLTHISYDQIWVAERGTQIMGWAVISQPSEVGGHYSVDKLWILDGARRVGVGGALLAELQAIADARKVYLFVEAMDSDCARRGMLEKHGYLNQGPIGLEGDVVEITLCYAKERAK